MDDSRQSFSLNMDGSSLADDMLEIIQEKPNITFKNITVTGNLEVDGEEIINEVETFKVKDAIVEFNNATPAVNADTGFTAKEVIAGNTRYKGLIFKSGQDVGIVYNNASAEPLTTLEQPYDLGTVRVRDANSQNEPITKQQFDNNTVKLSGNQNVGGEKTFTNTLITEQDIQTNKMILMRSDGSEANYLESEPTTNIMRYVSSSGNNKHSFFNNNSGSVINTFNINYNHIQSFLPFNMDNNIIYNLAEPVNDDDAATKKYVDDNAPTDYVTLSTNQTIDSRKTFTDFTTITRNVSFNGAFPFLLLNALNGNSWRFHAIRNSSETYLDIKSDQNNRAITISDNDGNHVKFGPNTNTMYHNLIMDNNNIIDAGVIETDKIALIRPSDGATDDAEFYVESNGDMIYKNMSGAGSHRFLINIADSPFELFRVDGEYHRVECRGPFHVNNSIMKIENTLAGMQSLLRFESARPWEFRTNNTGSGTSLELYSTAPEKGFKITTLTETSGDQDIAQFSESSVSIYTQQNLNDNDILDIDEAQVKRLTLIKPDDGNKSVANIRMVGNYISYDSLINSSFGGHRFYVKDGANDVMALQITRNHIDTNYKLNMGYNKIEQLAEPTANTDAATKNYVDNAVATAGSFNTDINMNDNNIQNINEAEAKKLILIRPSDNNKNVSSIYMESNYIRYDNLVNSGAAGHRFYTFNGFTNDLAFRIANSFIESNFELRMGNQKIEELAEPVVGSDAATKNYVDNIARSYSATVTSLSMSCTNLPIYSSYNVGAFNLTKTGHYMIDYTINIKQNEPTLTDRHFTLILTAPGSVGNLSAPGGARGIDLSRTGMSNSSTATGSINLKWIVEYTSTGIKQLTMDIGSRSGSGTPFEFYGNAIISRVVV